MPHSIAIQDKIVIRRYWGKVTLNEFRSAKEEISQLKGFDPTLPQIIDLGEADLQDIPLASAEELMKESSSASPLAILVLVVPDDSTMRAAQQFQQMGPATGRTIVTTRSLGEARATLAALSSRARQNR